MHKLLLIILLILTSPISLAGEQAPMVYRYWDFGASEKRDQYQFELLQLILEKTVATHGKYELIKVEKKYTPLRASREISKGEIMNIEASSHHQSLVAPDAKIVIQIPLLRGLLGYRKLIVRRADLDKFTAIKHADELKSLVAGQGKGWEDVSIYKFNHYKIYADSDFYNPFSLLMAHRFDYIPLSIIEAEDVIKKFPKYANDVAIVPNIIIYYPFPVLFNVSSHHPELAERVEKGLAIVQADGSLNRLFEKYFAPELHYLQNSDNKIFALDNPNIPESLKLPTLIHIPKNENSRN